MHHLLHGCCVFTTCIAVAVVSADSAGGAVAGEASALRGDPAQVAQRVDDQLSAEILSGKIIAPKVNDQVFLRRLSFDLIGELPTPAEVTSFQLDPSPDKRRRAVDAMLADPHFGQNWGRYWRDAILSRRSDDRAIGLLAESVTVFVTDAYNRDVGWDEIARRFVTSKGDIRRNGETAIIMAQQGKAAETAAEVSRLFLGIQIQCAQCHDHPYDNWTREQFHELAAFFPRTDIRPVRDSATRSFEVAALDSQGVRKLRKPKQNSAWEHYMPNLENPKAQGKLMQPILFLDGQSLDIGSTDRQRRKALAAWITDDQNPWFAKAYVNRLWAELVGRGFYETVDDLGTNRPCIAPKTLEYLAEQFTANGHSVKWLFRVITATEAYQRQSRARNELADAPMTANCAQPLRADQLLNALTSALGVSEPMPPTGIGRPRRGLNKLRTQFNLTFGYDPSINRDEVAASINQALLLMNSPQINQAVRTSARNIRLNRTPNSSDDDVEITEIYLRCLAREPTDSERKTSAEHIRSTKNQRQQAYEDIFWALINSTEFRLRS